MKQLRAEITRRGWCPWVLVAVAGSSLLGAGGAAKAQNVGEQPRALEEITVTGTRVRRQARTSQHRYVADRTHPLVRSSVAPCVGCLGSAWDRYWRGIAI